LTRSSPLRRTRRPGRALSNRRSGSGREPDYRNCAAAGIAALQRWYDPASGLWRGTGWWNCANALTALIRYAKLTGENSHADVIATTFTAAQRRHTGFVNHFHDDNAWWALAWLAAFDVTRDSRYLDTAEAIFARNTPGWTGACGGGLIWNKKSTYKNAITNELFLTLAALLHQRVPAGGYLTWAQREWEWFSASGMIGPDGLVNDGLTAACRNNAGTTWTYNQGVILGGLAALFEITGDRGYLTRGEAIAAAATGRLAPKGILAEPCEAAAAGCNQDQVQFKGIFVRYLYDFWRQSRQPAYRAFILANAGSLWARGRNAASQFGLRWSGPFDRADAARQSSALDALVAAAALTG
jgi:predicted alpha-1,6-mannanase (GH76 family)